jgi:hypothetical protein
MIAGLFFRITVPLSAYPLFGYPTSSPDSLFVS